MVEPKGENYLSSSLKKFLFQNSLLWWGCYVVLLLCLVEEKEGEDGDGRNGCQALFLGVWLAQNINLRDKLVVKHQFS